MDNNFSVYIHHNLINHKVYVGKTKKKPEHRWGRNGSNYGKATRFYAAIQEFSWDNFEHIIVARNIPEESAKQMEKELIKLYHANEEEYGYNMVNDGRSDDPEHYKERNRKKNARQKELLASDPERRARRRQQWNDYTERNRDKKNARRRERYAAMIAAMTSEELAVYRAKERERTKKYDRREK